MEGAASAPASAATEPKALPKAPASTSSMIASRAEVIAGSDQASSSPATMFSNTSSPPIRSVRYWMYISSGHTLCPAREIGMMPAAEKVSTAVSSSSGGRGDGVLSNRAVLW